MVQPPAGVVNSQSCDLDRSVLADSFERMQVVPVVGGEKNGDIFIASNMLVISYQPGVIPDECRLKSVRKKSATNHNQNYYLK